MSNGCYRLVCCVMMALIECLGCHSTTTETNGDDTENDATHSDTASDDNESTDAWLVGELDCDVENQIEWLGSKVFEITEAEGVEIRSTNLTHDHFRFIGKTRDGEDLKINLSYDSQILSPESLGLGESFQVSLQEALEDGSVSELLCVIESNEAGDASEFDEKNSSFRGEISIRPLSGRPVSVVELCVAVQPHHMSMDPYLVFHSSPLLMYSDYPCQTGLDQTCNESPIVSSLLGTCDEDGFCTCDDRAIKTAGGKCDFETDEI